MCPCLCLGLNPQKWLCFVVRDVLSRHFHRWLTEASTRLQEEHTHRLQFWSKSLQSAEAVHEGFCHAALLTWKLGWELLWYVSKIEFNIWGSLFLVICILISLSVSNPSPQVNLWEILSPAPGPPILCRNISPHKQLHPLLGASGLWRWFQRACFLCLKALCGITAWEKYHFLVWRINLHWQSVSEGR